MHRAFLAKDDLLGTVFEEVHACVWACSIFEIYHIVRLINILLWPLGNNASIRSRSYLREALPLPRIGILMPHLRLTRLPIMRSRIALASRQVHQLILLALVLEAIVVLIEAGLGHMPLTGIGVVLSLIHLP